MPPFQGFIGPAYQTRSLNAGVEDLVNLYVEMPESRSGMPALYGRPGQKLLMVLPDSPVRAELYQDQRSWAVAGGSYIETTSGVPVVIGPVANDGLPAGIYTNGQEGHQNFIVSGGFGYIHDLNSNAFGLIADSQFPQGYAVCGDFMDGFFLVVTNAAAPAGTSFQLSSGTVGTPEDGTNWSTPLYLAKRSIASDNIMRLIVNHREMWLFGSVTSEGWSDTGATNFPLAPIPGVFIDQGIGAVWSAVRLDNSVAWLAQNRDGNRTVMSVNQLAPQRISNFAVEESLRRCPTISDFIGYVFQEGGHLFYVLTSTVNKLTWVYDVSQGPKLGWARWSWLNPVSGLEEAILGRCHTAAFGSHWIGDRNSGNVYVQSMDYFTDNGNAILAVRQFPHINQEQKWIVYDLLQIDGEMGVGLQAPQQGSQPKLMLRWSDDGGHTFGNERREPMGPIGAYTSRAMFWATGAARNRVFRMTCSDPVKRAFTAAYLRTRAGQY